MGTRHFNTLNLLGFIIAAFCAIAFICFGLSAFIGGNSHIIQTFAQYPLIEVFGFLIGTALFLDA